MDIVQNIEGTSQRVGESAQSALSSMRHSNLVQRYVNPPSAWVANKYQQSPAPVRFLLMGFGAMSAIPIGCFLGFMGVVTLGCLVVGGIAFTIVEVRAQAVCTIHARPLWPYSFPLHGKKKKSVGTTK